MPSSGVLRLSDAIEIGLKNQPAVKQAHALTMAAQARADQAGAPLLPQVTLIAAYQRRAGPAFIPGAVPGGGTTPGGVPVNTTSTTNRAGIDIFTIRRQRNAAHLGFQSGAWSARAADQLAMSAEEQERVTAYFTAANIRRSYFVARDQKALVKVAADTRDNVQRHLEQTRGFVNVGMQPDIALARARRFRQRRSRARQCAEQLYGRQGDPRQQPRDPTAAALEIADDEIGVVEGED